MPCSGAVARLGINNNDATSCRPMVSAKARPRLTNTPETFTKMVKGPIGSAITSYTERTCTKMNDAAPRLAMASAFQSFIAST